MQFIALDGNLEKIICVTITICIVLDADFVISDVP